MEAKTDKTTICLRLPDELREIIAELARRENRTVSGQIRHLLEQAVTRPVTPDGN